MIEQVEPKKKTRKLNDPPGVPMLEEPQRDLSPVLPSSQGTEQTPELEARRHLSAASLPGKTESQRSEQEALPKRLWRVSLGSHGPTTPRIRTRRDQEPDKPIEADTRQEAVIEFFHRHGIIASDYEPLVEEWHPEQDGDDNGRARRSASKLQPSRRQDQGDHGDTEPDGLH